MKIRILDSFQKKILEKYLRRTSFAVEAKPIEGAYLGNRSKRILLLCDISEGEIKFEALNQRFEAMLTV